MTKEVRVKAAPFLYCLKQDLWDCCNCLNRGLSRITQMTRILGLVMAVGRIRGNRLNRDLCRIGSRESEFPPTEEGYGKSTDGFST